MTSPHEPPPPTSAPAPHATERALRPSLPWISAGSVLTVVGSLGSRLSNPLPDSALNASELTLGYAALLAVGGGAAFLHHRWRHLGSAAAADVPAPPAPATEPAAPADSPAVPLGPTIPDHPLARRVQAVLDSNFNVGAYYVATIPYTLDDNGECSSFDLRCSASGGFSSSDLRERVYRRVSESISGKWTMTAEPTADVLHWRIKAGFPGAVSMPLPPAVADSTASALQLYKSFRMPLGVDADGTILSIDPAAFPHFLIVGGTGSGKSVFNRGIIEYFRAQGWMLLLCDGKGTDYTGLIGHNNIVAVAQTTADILRTVRMAADELRARQSDAKRHQRARSGDPFRRPPILLLIDEFATVKANVDGDYGKNHTLIEDLKFITRLGREFKVHLCIATQEVYRDTIDGQILGNMKLRISLGPPEDKTIKEAFPEALRNEAARIGGTIDKDRDKGRAMALTSSDDGDNRVVEFQSFYGYSPGDPKPPPSVLSAAHEEFRITVTEQIPRLYPRLWFAVDSPEYGVDVEHLYGLPPVLLDGPDGLPDPQHYMYDPLRDEYNGNDEGASSPPIPALTELRDGVVFTPPKPRPSRTEPDLDDWGDDDVELPWTPDPVTADDMDGVDDETGVDDASAVEDPMPNGYPDAEISTPTDEAGDAGPVPADTPVPQDPPPPPRPRTKPGYRNTGHVNF